MEQTKENNLTKLIEHGINDSKSYKEYRTHISDLLSKDRSTGYEQSDELTNYSILNNSRMQRLDKTLKINEPIKSSINNIDMDATWLVLSEGWCSDSAQILPVIHKLAMLNEGIKLRIISRDDHDKLMNRFLTNGSKSIPKLIIYDNANKEILNSWGPRPSIATRMVKEYKDTNGKLDSEFKQSLQLWYNKDRGVNIIEDIAKLL